MRLGYVIIHVPTVPAALAFYERAFGFKRRFLAPGGEYGELQSGATEAKPPAEKPWDQTVAYVRDLNGFLVEICSPSAG